MKNILSPLQIEQVKLKLKELDGNKTVIESYRQLIDIHEKFIAKVNELDEIIKNKVGPKGNKGDPGPKGDKGDAGDIRNINEVINIILPKIPKAENGKPGKDGLTPQRGIHYFTKKDIKDLTNTIKSLVKIPSSEEKQIDPMKIIEAIEKLPEGKKLSSRHIDGLEQTISAIRNQTKRGYLHGGGDTVSAGTNITITKTATGTKIISATGGAFPQMTTAQRLASSPINGSTAYDTNLNVAMIYVNGVWGTILLN